MFIDQRKQFLKTPENTFSKQTNSNPDNKFGYINYEQYIIESVLWGLHWGNIFNSLFLLHFMTILDIFYEIHIANYISIRIRVSLLCWFFECFFFKIVFLLVQ